MSTSDTHAIETVEAGNWDSNHLIGQFQSATVSPSEFQA